MSLSLKRQMVSVGPRFNQAMLAPTTSRRHTSCIIPKAIAVLSGQGTMASSQVVDTLRRQQTGYSYVNFKATAADFERVLARLAASASLPSEARAAPAPERRLPLWCGRRAGLPLRPSTGSCSGGGRGGRPWRGRLCRPFGAHPRVRRLDRRRHHPLLHLRLLRHGRCHRPDHAPLRWARPAGRGRATWR